MGLIKPLGNHCSDLVANVGEIVTLLDTGTKQDLKESVGKLNESIAKVKETSREINEALNELKSNIVDDDKDEEAGGKSKAEKIIAKFTNIIEDITNISEHCLEVSLQVDLIVNKEGQENLLEQKDAIVESFKKIKERALHMKDTMKDIINIIIGKKTRATTK